MTSRMYVHQAISPVLVVLRSAVVLEAGGAGTYTQRAVPGPDLFRVSSGQT